MPVTDDQVAALRALLVDDQDRHRQLFGQLDRAEARTGYPALVTAAFGEAVERRFGQRYQPADVVVFVADVRPGQTAWLPRSTPTPPNASSTPSSATQASATWTGKSVTRAKLVLLAALVADARLDDAALDEFLAAARKLADQLMS